MAAGLACIVAVAACGDDASSFDESVGRHETGFPGGTAGTGFGNVPGPGLPAGGTTATGGTSGAPGSMGMTPMAGMGGFTDPASRDAGVATEPPPPPLPDEVETALDLGLPQASKNYVYATNPEAGKVVIIHAETLTIRTVEAGVRPTYLKTLANTDDAIVLNAGSDDATVIRSPAAPRTHTVPVVRGANSIGVTPDGAHAVAWFDSEAPGATPGSGSFQDVTVIALADGNDQTVDMTVGFRPRAVMFSADSTKAYVVTEDGVSILDFADVDAGGSNIAPLVTLGPDVDQQAADVAVTPDGRYALAREPGASDLRLVDLRDGRVRSLDVATIPGVKESSAAVEVNDLDLAPNGAFALAVLRNQRAVLRIPVPGGFDDKGEITIAVIAGEIIGSAAIAPTSDRALVYTTAKDEERITVLDLDVGGDVRTVALRKSIRAVAIAPDGETALIVHDKLPGSPDEAGLDPDVSIDRAHGYSVLRLDTGAVKLQVTKTAPGAFTLVPDSSFLFMLFRDDGAGVRAVHQVAMDSFLVTPFPLGSPPISVGAVPASMRVFVNQEHPDGRITFIDWISGDARTVTGYELNSTIRD
jgi:hypothetical protein